MKERNPTEGKKREEDRQAGRRRERETVTVRVVVYRWYAVVRYWCGFSFVFWICIRGRGTCEFQRIAGRGRGTFHRIEVLKWREDANLEHMRVCSVLCSFSFSSYLLLLSLLISIGLHCMKFCTLMWDPFQNGPI